MFVYKDKEYRAHCPKCDGERKCVIIGQADKSWEWVEEKIGYGVTGEVKHSLLECRGCEKVFYEQVSSNSEERDIWTDPITGEEVGKPSIEVLTYPKPESRSKPAWLSKIASLDQQLFRILDQMYTAYDNGGFILTAIGLRTALDRSTELLKIGPSKTFEQKLDDLTVEGHIGKKEKEVLGVMTDAGSAAAHRAWEPNPTEIRELLSVLETFLYRNFIVGDAVLKTALSIPPKPKARPKSADKPDKNH